MTQAEEQVGRLQGAEEHERMTHCDEIRSVSGC